MRKVTILLPTRDNEMLLNHAIRGLRFSTEYPFKLIIMNGGNKVTVDTKEGDQIIEGKWTSNIQAIVEGLKYAEEDSDILLIHDDMNFFRFVGGDWLLYMTKLAENKEIGMMTYLNNISATNEDYNYQHWIGSWFCYVPRETIKKVGWIDENMKIAEDIDYSYRVEKAGLKLLMTEFWHEHHRLRETKHTDQSEDIKKEAVLYFRKKHGL